jgi:hypothetical protein
LLTSVVVAVKVVIWLLDKVVDLVGMYLKVDSNGQVEAVLLKIPVMVVHIMVA